jgi:hypothetical protein
LTSATSSGRTQCTRLRTLIAREQEAKLWELRAAVSLAQLRRYQDRRAEARDLTPIYGWFIEGFETPDLKEAKALLNELQCTWALPKHVVARENVRSSRLGGNRASAAFGSPTTTSCRAGMPTRG